MASDLPDWVLRATRMLASAGLNLWGTGPGDDYQDILPGCRSVIVFGSAGRLLWDRFVDHLRGNPERLSDQAHPLDSFIDEIVQQADPDPQSTRKWIRCSPTESLQVDFRTLAATAGLGSPSALGLILNEEAGPWLGLRAACFTTEALPLSARHELSPCTTCTAPCADACPANAIVVPFRPRDPSSGWQVSVCARWNTDTDTCRSACASRLACPIGVEHQYSALELAYHQNRTKGRAALARELGIVDRESGVPPPWHAWTSMVPRDAK